jgi:hypothetical protein
VARRAAASWHLAASGRQAAAATGATTARHARSQPVAVEVVAVEHQHPGCGRECARIKAAIVVAAAPPSRSALHGPLRSEHGGVEVGVHRPRRRLIDDSDTVACAGGFAAGRRAAAGRLRSG